MTKDEIRERLVELVNEAFDECIHTRCMDCEYNIGNVKNPSDRSCQVRLFADLLIAHGVTVQGWISVKDRLPEPFVPVLVQMPGEAPHPTVREGFISKDGIWYSALYHREPDEITHWQPMPEPPKEVE